MANPIPRRIDPYAPYTAYKLRVQGMISCIAYGDIHDDDIDDDDAVRTNQPITGLYFHRISDGYMQPVLNDNLFIPTNPRLAFHDGGRHRMWIYNFRDIENDQRLPNRQIDPRRVQVCDVLRATKQKLLELLREVNMQAPDDVNDDEDVHVIFAALKKAQNFEKYEFDILISEFISKVIVFLGRTRNIPNDVLNHLLGIIENICSGMTNDKTGWEKFFGYLYSFPVYPRGGKQLVITSDGAEIKTIRHGALHGLWYGFKTTQIAQYRRAEDRGRPRQRKRILLHKGTGRNSRSRSRSRSPEDIEFDCERRDNQPEEITFDQLINDRGENYTIVYNRLHSYMNSVLPDILVIGFVNQNQNNPDQNNPNLNPNNPNPNGNDPNPNNPNPNGNDPNPNNPNPNPNNPNPNANNPNPQWIKVYLTVEIASMNKMGSKEKGARKILYDSIEQCYQQMICAISVDQDRINGLVVVPDGMMVLEICKVQNEYKLYESDLIQWDNDDLPDLLEFINDIINQ